MQSADRMVTGDDLDVLRELEESLWRPETRFDDDYMERIFAADFFEFGRSGRRYRRDEMFFGGQGLTDIAAEFPLRNFSARFLSDDIVQVTYISQVTYGADVQYGNRSSIWNRDAGEWKLRFHQGTPCQPPPT